MKTYTLELRGAVAIDGVLKRAGELIEVDESVAKNLLYRGKAVVAAGGETPAENSAQPAQPDGTSGDGAGDTQPPQAATKPAASGKRKR